MADDKKIVLSIEVNEGNSSVEIEKVVKGLDNLKKANDETGEKTLSLRAQMKKLREELAQVEQQFGEGSAEYVQASAKLGALKDKMDAMGESVATLSGDPLERLNSSFGMIGSSVMSLDFGKATTGIKGVASAIKDVKPKDVVSGIKDMGKAFIDIGKALLGNPIFAIVGAIVAIGMAINELMNMQREAVTKTNESIEKAQASRHENERELMASAGKDIQRQYEIRKQSAEKDRDDTLTMINNLERQKRRLKGLDEEQEKKLVELKANLKKQEVDLEVMKLERINALREASRQVDLKYEMVGLNDRQRAYKQLEQQQTDSITKLQEMGVDEATIEKQRKINADERSRLDKQYYKEDSEKRKQKKESERENAEWQRELEASIYTNKHTEAENELKNLQVNYEKKKEEAKKHKVDLKIVDEWYNSEVEKLERAKQLKALEIQKESNRIHMELFQELLSLQEQAQSENELSQMTTTERELQAVDTKYFEMIEKARQFNASLKEEEQYKAIDITAMEDAQARERNSILLQRQFELQEARNGLMLTGREQEFAELELEYAQKQEMYKNDADMLVIIEAEKQEKIRQLNLKTIQENLEWTQRGADAVQSIGDAVFAHKMKNVKKDSKEAEALAKKQFKFNKAMQLAGATIDMAKGITASLASAPVAIGVVPNPAGIASLAMVTATGLANIAKISATKFESPVKPDSPSPSGGGGGGGGTPTAPALDLSFVNNDNTKPQPLQTYVLSNHVASSLEAQQKIEDQARIK